MRRRRIPSGVVILLAALTAGPVAAQSPGASPGVAADPSASPAAAGVPFCSDVPEIVIPAERFRDTPVYIGNEQPTGELRRWARQQPGFQDLWIDRDHLGWVVLAFSEDAEARQADLEREFPGVGAVAVKVDWTTKELEALQQKAVVQPRDLVQGTGTDILKGVVFIMVGVLEPGRVAEIGRRFAGDRVCIDGIDPATVPAPGPQPQAGDGWRLLGDAKVGAPYRTGIAADRSSFKALWKQARMPGRPPTVDFEREVAIWFGAVYGGSCPAIRLDDVVVDTDAALVHPLIVQTEPVMACTDDANGHAYLVALDRDRLPAPPFRIQLQAGDPPLGATREITLVDADLREPGSVPGPGEVRTIKPPQDQRLVRSGDIVEPGFPAQVVLDARCGFEWLGQLNDIWWRTEVAAGETAWVPDAWGPAVDAEGMLEVTVLLRQADDPAVTDGQPRAEATLNGQTVVYQATTEAPPACP
jgi:hypothetical protein